MCQEDLCSNHSTKECCVWVGDNWIDLINSCKSRNLPEGIFGLRQRSMCLWVSGSIWNNQTLMFSGFRVWLGFAKYGAQFFGPLLVLPGARKNTSSSQLEISPNPPMFWVSPPLACSPMDASCVSSLCESRGHVRRVVWIWTFATVSHWAFCDCAWRKCLRKTPELNLHVARLVCNNAHSGCVYDVLWARNWLRLCLCAGVISLWGFNHGCGLWDLIHQWSQGWSVEQSPRGDN